MSRLFRFKRDKEESWADYYTRTCRVDCRKNVASHGMGLRSKTHCGDQHREKAFSDGEVRDGGNPRKQRE